MSTVASILDYYLEPLASMINREMAEAIVNRKPDPQLVARITDLGQKAEQGTLTDIERDEYRDLIDAGDLISLLKSKARKFLDENPA